VTLVLNLRVYALIFLSLFDIVLIYCYISTSTLKDQEFVYLRGLTAETEGERGGSFQFPHSQGVALMLYSIRG
jgi:hypothetical protein